MPIPVVVAPVSVRPAPLREPIRRWIKWIRESKCYCQSRDDGFRIVPLVPTAPQYDLMRRIWQQAGAGVPIRIIVPKFRRGGVSTFIQALIDFLCNEFPSRVGSTLAHTDDDTRSIFNLAKTCVERTDWAAGLTASSIQFANGSRHDCRTAGAKAVKRGSGIHYLHITELAYLESTQGLDRQAVNSLYQAVADDPETVVIFEGTGNGPQGEFYRRVKVAEAGGDEFALCFLPWNIDKRNVRAVAVGDAPFVATEEESSLALAYQLTPEQLAWRRFKRAQFGSDQDFKREFPISVDECFEVAGGRVYPLFTAARHVKKVEILPTWKRYRSVDWGWSVNHAFVCLWIAHDPSHPPRLVVSPDCPETKREMVAYRRDERTGQRIERDDHTCDALRMAIITYQLTGLVYVYRELYVLSASQPEAMARRIHELSGWELPPNVDERVLSLYRPGRGCERYVGNVADRQAPGLINQFNDWGLPFELQTRPVPRGTSGPGETMEGKGEVEDGIAIVSALLTGDALFFAPELDRVGELKARVVQVTRSGRPRSVDLNDEEERILAEAEKSEFEAAAGAGRRGDGYDPMREFMGGN